MSKGIGYRSITVMYGLAPVYQFLLCSPGGELPYNKLKISILHQVLFILKP